MKRSELRGDRGASKKMIGHAARMRDGATKA